MATAIGEKTRDSEWFEAWFDSPHYHRLYAHRDETEAARFLDGLIAWLGLRRAACVLDLGCGAGRHSRYLAAQGFQVTGIDLATSSIREAKKSEGPFLQFARHDMRVPFGHEAFDCVFNFFTSFGYFEEPGEHLAVVRNMAASLRPGGRLVLDYLNVRHAETSLTPEENKEIEGATYRLSRWADARYFFKRVVVDAGSGEPREYVERVAKFALKDFERMLAAHELSIEAVFGDYHLNAYDPAMSPRMILVARKRESVSRVSWNACDTTVQCGTNDVLSPC
jgi:SAM-dependent methyltransferase